MIHGPCGALNLNSPCMVEGKCSKRFPKNLVSDTVTGNDGYPEYRRRSTEDNGHSVTLRVKNQDLEIDNRWVVPYSPLLSKIYKAHINVEVCNSVQSIKYICKYINKGSDMAVFGAVANVNDEITKFQMGRYISSNEAVWRILSFPIHDRHPTVVHLAVHPENGQRVFFTPGNAMRRAAQPPATTLTAFFSLCQADDFAKTLLYAEVPEYYTWNNSSKVFQRRRRGKAVHGQPVLFHSDAIGRIYTVHPNNQECYYWRLLLINVREPTSFESLRTVDEELCGTYREACERLNMLENDMHWVMHPHQIQTLFAIIIATCSPAKPIELCQKHQNHLSEDFLHRLRRQTGDINAGNLQRGIDCY
ncbi:uncharacterized protein LOC121405025 [Drosophila obscura]|uniref:uncharacterized protein LOC121405025 n=1 Tax=Drosophila obscura TaxID=7282 RepID=UPI001BB1BA43|nr:uncharacterized protein LOC121405025 [Drosophila obscura]XP_041451494.1 uncharacterized protein LOC121405025 [Drosophila obscura]